MKKVEEREWSRVREGAREERVREAGFHPCIKVVHSVLCLFHRCNISVSLWKPCGEVIDWESSFTEL